MDELIFIGLGVAALVNILPQWNETKKKWPLVVSVVIAILLAGLGYYGAIENQAIVKSQTDSLNRTLEKSNEIQKHLTGGNSYATAEIRFNQADSIGVISLANNGKYTIPFTAIYLTDLNTKDSREKFEKAIMFGHSNLYASTEIRTKTFIKLDKSKGVFIQFQFNYAPPKENTYQKIRMQFVNNRWLMASEIAAFDTTIYRIDPSFPIQDRKKIFNQF